MCFNLDNFDINKNECVYKLYLALWMLHKYENNEISIYSFIVILTSKNVIHYKPYTCTWIYNSNDLRIGSQRQAADLFGEEKFCLKIKVSSILLNKTELNLTPQAGVSGFQSEISMRHRRD